VGGPFGRSSIVPSASVDETDARASPRSAPAIAEHHPSLGVHLRRMIRTGTYCAYLPDPNAAGWQV
jgi:hypothetical protein